MNPTETDILVIGGGPAGTTFASLMQMKGWQVTLLEKDRHPRFHIGESLLPMNVPILETLGVLDRVKRIGVPKLGADFTLPNSSGGHQTYYFRSALGNSPDHAFEVRRSEFDELLFRNSQEKGVQALEGMKVNVIQPEGSHHLVDATDEQGQAHQWRARFLVDASGRDAFMAGKNGWKQRNSRHASAAVFGHFRGVERRPGEDQGNISIYWFESGWIWMIPLHDDIMSIGMVCSPEHMKTRQGSLDEFLKHTLEGLDEARQRVQGADLVMPAQATGNYSYFSRQMMGPGYILLGDAYAFIDPVFSSGVYLAMNSAERSTRVAEAWLKNNQGLYRRECRRYRNETRKGISVFSWFIYRFNSPVMRNLLNNPNNVLKVVQAVISMLAGDVFTNRTVDRRLLVFKTIYTLSWLRNWPSALASRNRRLASARAALKAQQTP